MSYQRLSAAYAFLVLLVLAAPPLWGQGSVTIFGAVTDSSEAVIPGASVTVTNQETGLTRTVETDASGDYLVGQLPIGVYTVRVESAGFKTFSQTDIQVQVDDNRRVDVTLEVGEVTETVTVAAEATQVDTRSGTLREVVDSERIVELPLNGRNPVELQYLVAGVGRRAGQGQAQNESVSVNGSRTNSNNYILDGGDNHDPYFNTPSVYPSPDALEEFSIQTSSYSAELGRNAGAVMNAVTKSGTNELHGTLFEFLRNEKLNARNFFANDVPPFKRNQFGGTLGGPIIKNRTFFFGSYQHTAQRSAPGAVTATVPTAAERAGDLSSVNTQLEDPEGGVFPNNQIPQDRLYQPSLDFLDAFVPLPNRPDGLLSTSSQESIDDDQIIAKVDHQVSDANRLFVRLLYAFNDRSEATGNLPGFLAGIEYSNWQWTVNDTHILNPTTLNTFTFSYSDIDRKQLSIVPGNLSWNDFGANFTRTFTADAPVAHHTQVDGYFNAFSRFPLNHFRKNFQFGDTLSMTRGNHNVKFGGEVRRSILDLQEYFRGDPFVRFRNQFTGSPLADMLIGRPQQIAQIAEDSNMPRTFETALFVQDDWKVARRLTLNLGLRYEPYFPFIDKTNKFSQIRFGEQSTLFPTAPEGLVFPGDPGVPRAMVDTRYGNFAPRFGFAFDPFGDGKSSIRGGYGVFYSMIRQQAHNQISTNQPYSIKLTINNPPGGLDNPYAETGNPFPFVPPQTDEERANYEFLTPLEVTMWDPNFRNAVVQQWNFNIQRQIGRSYIATAAYVGSKGNHLFMANQLNPAIFGRPGNVNQRRLFGPTYGPVTNQSSQGNSTYHALQLTLNKRLTNGFTVLANYTFSKLLDNASSDGDGPANPFDIAREKGHSDFDITHRTAISYIWQLPRLRNQPGVIRYLFGGWENNGIITAESGQWLTVNSGADRSGSAVNADRADLVGDPVLSSDRSTGEKIQEFFNTAAFELNDPGTFGTSGRNILQGPGQFQVDFGLFKNIPITERYRLQFRAEMFNLFNSVNLGNPTTNASAGNFGRITGADDPRVIQMALKLMF